MTGSLLLRRPLKVLAAIAVVVGVLAASVGLVGGLEMGGAIIQGDLREDALRLAFLILPFIAAALLVFGTVRELGRPAAATSIYMGVLILVAAQLILPAVH